MVDKAERHDLPGAKEAGDEYRNNPDADYHKYVAEHRRAGSQGGEANQFHENLRRRRGRDRAKTGLSLEKAQEVMAKYDAALPFVKKLSQIYQNQAERTGITEIMGGAKRHWNKFEAPWKGDTPCLAGRGTAPRRRSRAPLAWPEAASRQDLRALNAAIQGDAAIHIKNWMLPASARASCRSLQIHDELLCK